MSSQNIGCQHHDTMIYTLKENPVVEQNTLFSCPTLYMFYLEIINPEKLLDIWHFLISTETSVKSNFLEIH
jgi:hypothetical protein